MPMPERNQADLDGFLRAMTESPDLARGSAFGLGRRYGLSPELVAEVLEVLAVYRQSDGFQGIPSRLQEAGKALLAALDRAVGWMARWPAVAIPLVLAGMAGLLAVAGAHDGPPSRTEWVHWTGTTAVVSVVMHRNRRARHALLATVLFALVLGWHEVDWALVKTSRVALAEEGLKLLAGSAAFLVAVGVWSVWDWIASSVFVEDPVSDLGRQQMISRLVQLQRQIREGSPTPATPHILNTRWAETIRGVSLLLGFGGGFLVRSVVQSEIALGGPGATLALIPMAAGLVGFFSVEGAVAVLAGVLFAIGFGTPDLVGLTSSLPVGLVNPLGLWLLSGIGALAGSLVAQGARGRHVRELRAMGNAASAIAEVIRIQWRMEAVPSNVCVMSVDVAGSSQMKMDAAPLLAEYSFREYQRYVAEIVEAHQGRIHSTAGDGVVAAFDSCRKATAAAREIQSGLCRFNNESNRLRMPFRLRIGLHMDSVAGDLRDVEFSRVIDVAAHVEGVAPVGGVAVTEPVAKRLLGERLDPAPTPVDGIPVYHLSLVEAA